MGAKIIEFHWPSSRLHADYLAGKMEHFFVRSFHNEKALTEAFADIDSCSYPRQTLRDVLLKKNIELGASPETLANIESLIDSRSLCVFAGQQTGLLLGPMYVIYKALAAVKLARHYEHLLGRKIIPCFWMATDDHDFAEVKSVAFPAPNGVLHRYEYSPSVALVKTPMTSIVLDDNIIEFVNRVADDLPETEFKSSMVAGIRSCYKPGEKLTDAFGKLLMRFLGKYGLVLVDPNAPEFKRNFVPIFAGEIDAHEKLFELYDSRSKDLLEAGYHAQVHKVHRQLNLFYHSPERNNIMEENKNSYSDGAGNFWPKRELLDKVQNRPELFSPNVLLRPIAQCKVFPVVAQIVGPSELAYFAQIEPWFDFFRIPHPVVVPRPSATLVEPHIGKIIDKYSLSYAELKADQLAVAAKVIERLFPSEAAESLIADSADYCGRLDLLADRLHGSDPDAANILKSYRKKIDFEASQIAKKLRSSNKKKHEEIFAQIKKAYDALFPNNQLQERVVTPIYFACKYGETIFDKVFDNLDIEHAKHMAIYL